MPQQYRSSGHRKRKKHIASPVFILISFIIILALGSGIFLLVQNWDTIVDKTVTLMAAGKISAAPSDYTLAPGEESSPVPTVNLSVSDPTPTLPPDTDATPTNSDASVLPATTPNPDTNVIQISAVGNIKVQASQLDDAYNSTTGAYDFTSVFSEVSPYIQYADLSFANLDTTISGADQEFTGHPNYNSPETLLTALKNAGFDVLNTANNQTFDRKWYGVEQTIANIKAAGLQYTGTYLSKDEYYAPLIIEVKGVKIAYITYTDSTSDQESTIPSDKLAYCIKNTNIDSITRDIKASRQQGADIVIVGIHWGKENTKDPTTEDKSLAEKVLKAGADVILGTHPNMIQSITRKTITRDDGTTAEGVVVYSMGDFVSSSVDQYKDTGMIVNITYKKDNSGKIALDTVTYTPTYVSVNEDTSSLTDFCILPAYRYANSDALLNSLSSKAQDRVKNILQEVQSVIPQANASMAVE